LRNNRKERDGRGAHPPPPGGAAQNYSRPLSALRRWLTK
jgi:hypothetical protein